MREKCILDFWPFGLHSTSERKQKISLHDLLGKPYMRKQVKK